MNIEEIKKIVRQEMEDCSPAIKEVLKLNDSLKYWGNKCKKQEKEIEELNIIIRTAIEYIEEGIDFPYYDEDTKKYFKEIEDILKGKDE